MGGWKLEAFRFLGLITFPVGSFYVYNQTGLVDYLIEKFPKESKEKRRKDALAIKAWKDNLAEEQRRAEYESFLRQQMAFEEARLLREKAKVGSSHH